MVHVGRAGSDPKWVVSRRWGPQGKGRAVTGFRQFAPDGSATSPNNLTAQLEPDPRAWLALRCTVEVLQNPAGSLEDAFAERLRNTCSSVRHRKLPWSPDVRRSILSGRFGSSRWAIAG